MTKWEGWGWEEVKEKERVKKRQREREMAVGFWVVEGEEAMLREKWGLKEGDDDVALDLTWTMMWHDM